MLIIRCAECKRKLIRYFKKGPGEVHRCHKSRIDRFYEAEEREKALVCACGNRVGIDKGRFYKMIRKSFSYSGTKTKG